MPLPPDLARLKPSKRTARVKRLAGLSTLLLLIALADIALYPRLARPHGPAPQLTGNGVWLHHSWYFGTRSEAEVGALAERLTEHRIRNAYFHVRFITPSGRLRYRLPRAAQRLTGIMHHSSPGIRNIAWIYAGNRAGLGSVDLANVAVRRRMVAEAVWLVTVCGFDGVQWDYEICPDGDAGFLALLRETRAALPKGKWLSVATPLWSPFPVGPHGWREPMFAEVAAVTDEVVVMGYDSGLYWPRLYSALMRAQVEQVARAIQRRRPACRLLIGVPTYAAGGRSHSRWTESLRVALLGVRAGLDHSSDARSTVSGIALFAEYTTQPEEWELYHRWWVSPPPASNAASHQPNGK